MRYRTGDTPEDLGPGIDQGSFLAIGGTGLSISSIIYMIYVLTIL